MTPRVPFAAAVVVALALSWLSATPTGRAEEPSPAFDETALALLEDWRRFRAEIATEEAARAFSEAVRRDARLYDCLVAAGNSGTYAALMYAYDRSVRGSAYGGAPTIGTYAEVQSRLTAAPDDAGAWRDRALLHAAAGDWLRADADLTVARSLDDAPEQVDVLLAILWWGWGDVILHEFAKRHGHDVPAFQFTDSEIADVMAQLPERPLSLIEHAMAAGADGPIVDLVHAWAMYPLETGDSAASSAWFDTKFEAFTDLLATSESWDDDGYGAARLIAALTQWGAMDALRGTGRFENFGEELEPFLALTSRYPAPSQCPSRTPR